MKKFKTITSLTDDMKANFDFVYYIYKEKDLKKIENPKVGNAVALSKWRWHKWLATDILIFDGSEWCIYDVHPKIFESDNFDRIGELPHPSGKGLLVVLYNYNCEEEKPVEFFLVFTTDDNIPYVDVNSRKCRIYADRPEYLVGYDENCKLTKEEKEVFIKILSTTDRTFPKQDSEYLETGWEWYLKCYNSYQEIDHIDDTIDTKPIPNYNLLEEE